MAEERKELVEECTGEVKLLRRSGSFENNKGETVDYKKLVLSIDGVEVEFDIEKSSKNLINGFVKFVEVKA